MELHQIRYFLALADELNFTRAAERCGVSQPSLTRAIKRLEEELGTQLVRRERNRTHLTQIGRQIKPRLQQALSLTEKVRSEADKFTQTSSTTLTVGVMCTVGPGRLISLIDHLESQFPKLSLRLRTSSGKEVINWLLQGEVDVALIGMPDYPNEISVSDLYSERYMVAFPKNHRFTQMESIPLQELEGEQYLERLNCEYMEFFHSALSNHDSCIRWKLEDSLRTMVIRHESVYEEWIQAMIVAGLGCAIVPQYMSIYSQMSMRPLIEPELSRTIGLATVRGRQHAPAVGMFCDLCRQMNWGPANGEQPVSMPP